MHLLCPHCRNPIELVRVTPREDISCPSCGSSFQLETVSTTAEQDTPRRLGKFDLLSTLGQGGFGTVYKAHDSELDRTVAVKVPRAGNLAGPQELDRFLREARSVAQLRHPSIVSVHEVGQTDGLPYLVSDFVEGVTLADLLSARRPGFREAAELVASVAEALEYAHRHGVVHRDVKPSNIMIGPGGAPCVMDFGLAKRDAGEITMTVEGQVLGTPAYMSPEQARGEAHQVDGRSDVYSLGVILYELLTGERPFRGTKRMLLYQVLHDDPRPPRNLNDRIPRDLETICLKAMAREPGRRYATAGHLGEDLRRWLRGEPILARPVGRLERFVRWTRRHPASAALLAVSAVAALALVGLGVGFVYHTQLNEAYEAEAVARQEENTQRKKAEEAMGEAERARQGEEEERKKAEDARRGEEVQRKRAEDALRQAARTNDIHSLLLADLARKDNDLVRAKVLLEEARSQQAGWEWRFLQAQCHTELIALPAQTLQRGDRVIAFSPDGRRLATVGTDHAIRLWDILSGQEVQTLRGHTGPVRTMAFRPGGKFLASAGTDGTLRVWDLAAGKQAKSVNFPAFSLIYSPDGRHLAAITQNATQVWDAETGKPALEKPLQAGIGLNGSLDISPDGKRLIVAMEQATGLHFGVLRNSAAVADWAAGKTLFALPSQVRSIQRVAFNPDGSTVATASWTGEVKLWDATSGKLVRTLDPAQKELTCLAFSPDGRLIAAGGFAGAVKVWIASTGQLARTYPGHAGSVRCLTFSPDGRLLASAGEDNKARIWDINFLPEAMVLAVPSRHVLGLAFSADGRHIAGASLAGEDVVQVYDVAIGQRSREIRLGGYIGGCPVAWSRDGRWLAAGGRDNEGVQLFEAKTGKPTLQLTPAAAKNKPNDLATVSIAFSNDSSRLAALHHNGRLGVWDVASKKEILHIPGCHSGVNVKIAFSPDGAMLACPMEDNSIKVWSSQTGEERFTLKGHTSEVGALAFSPDGTTLASGSRDQTVKLWDVRTSKELRTLRGHSGKVSDVAYSPDGRLLVTGSWDGTVKLWDVETGKETLSLSGRSSSVSRVAFSPDGKRLAAGNDSGQVLVWHAPDSPTDDQLVRRKVVQQTQLAWHRERTETAERERQLFMLAFHLGRLLESEPDNLRHRIVRGLALSQIGRADEAKPEFVKALERKDELSAAHRAEALAFLGKWKEAAEFFEKAAQARPEERLAELKRENEGKGLVGVNTQQQMARLLEDIGLWYRAALLQVYLGDVPAYRKAAEFTIKRYGFSPRNVGLGGFDVASANQLAWLCALGPDVSGQTEALGLIQQALRNQPGNPALLHTHGCLLYRAGKHDEAQKQLEAARTAQTSSGRVLTHNWFVLPMILHRSGKVAEARKLLDELKNQAGEVEKSAPWPERLELEVFRREAEALLKEPPNRK